MNNYIITKANNTDLNIINNHIYIKNKKNDCIDYENSVCIKPWGHEFLIYKNKKIGIWFLKINNGHKTSLHCHFNKDTIIICLKGCAKIELINNLYAEEYNWKFTMLTSEILLQRIKKVLKNKLKNQE